VEEGQPKTKGLHLYSCLGATCPIVNLNQETCEYYDKKYRQIIYNFIILSFSSVAVSTACVCWVRFFQLG
jgi:hypothetical protein